MVSYNFAMVNKVIFAFYDHSQCVTLTEFYKFNKLNGFTTQIIVIASDVACI